jgi:hypothetical protein
MLVPLLRTAAPAALAGLPAALVVANLVTRPGISIGRNPMRADAPPPLIGGMAAIRDEEVDVRGV